jgi:hypothetical protein
MLPASKDDFPKALCLDQNKWIDLARAHYKRADGEPFRDVLRVVRTAVEAGRLLVPFSIVNAIEAMIARDTARRERLARFMVDLSRNLTIVPEQVVCRWEIGNAIKRLFGKGSETPGRPLAIKRGVAHALGLGLEILGPANVAEAAARHFGSPEMTLSFLQGIGSKRDSVNRAVAGETTAVDVFQADRKHFADMSLEQRREREFVFLFLEPGTYRSELEASLSELAISVRDFRNQVRAAQDAIKFMAGIPNLDVLLTLRLARDKEHNRPVERNDIRDLDWLSVAVPYSNVVVSEKYWGSKVRTTRLDRKYRTVLLTDLRELPKQLEEMGCVT